jgi:uncharacterized protein YukE
MSFEGMDVDQLRALAKRIESDAQALYNLVTSLNGIVGVLSLIWHGPVAVTFELEWESKNRPALLAAYNILNNLHTHLVDNIDQQTSASATEGGWTVGRIIGDFGNALTAEGLVDTALSFSAKATKFLNDTHLDYVLKGAGLISIGIGAYQTGTDAFRVGEDLGAGQYGKAANDFTSMVADGLETFPNPVTFGLGVDLKLADQVANLDWKDVPSPFSGSNFEQDYVPVLKSMGTGAFWEQAGKTLWGDM